MTWLSRTQTALLSGLGWRIGIKRVDMYGTMENRLTFLFLSSGSTCRELFMKINASKSWKLARTSPNVARKINISSVRDRKVSCSCVGTRHWKWWVSSNRTRYDQSRCKIWSIKALKLLNGLYIAFTPLNFRQAKFHPDIWLFPFVFSFCFALILTSIITLLG